MLPVARGRADKLCPSPYHRVTSHVLSGSNRSAILTGNHAGTSPLGISIGLITESCLPDTIKS
jgi:hypothetical protein